MSKRCVERIVSLKHLVEMLFFVTERTGSFVMEEPGEHTIKEMVH
jgi:hypothetical protein